MNNTLEKVFKYFTKALTYITLSMLLFVICYIIKESIPIFKEVSLKDFILGKEWVPIDFGFGTKYGIQYFILGTLMVSFVAVVISMFISVGVSLLLTVNADDRVRRNIFPIIDLLSGIPSVVYGFIALELLSPLFFRLGVKTGNCVLLAAIVLSIMTTPFMISSVTYTFVNLKSKYMLAIKSLGVDEWYGVTTIIIPKSIKKIVLSLILANCRAMGETMAVMMVMGNAIVFPTLLGKGESIASLIALEMGTAVRGSNHYHALYAAGLILMLIVLLINIVLHTFSKEKE
jgi:phosphate transport system permease protein